MSCCVKNCNNIRRLMSSDTHNISFHRIPKKMFDKYIEKLGLASRPYSIKYVCSEHFLEEDFIISKNNKRLLRKGAIPCRNICHQQSDVYNLPATSRSEAPMVEEPQAVPSFVLPKPGSSPLRGQGHRRPSSSTSSTVSIATSEKKGGPEILSRLPSAVRPLESSDSVESSTSSETKRRRGQLVKVMHSYSISPRKVKAKYLATQKSAQKKTKQIYAAKRTICSLKQTVSSLKEIVARLNKERRLSENALDHLQRVADAIPRDLFQRYLKNVNADTITREEYPASLRKFAITLQFYSCKAYEYVRKTFALALPHQSTLRNWFSAVNCEPGFQTESFSLLKTLCNGQQTVICSLMLDEMAIKKKLEVQGDRVWGYVDFGVDLQDDDVEPATEALVLLIVSHTGSWKLPIAYFLIKTLTGLEKANIVKEALIRLAEVGVEITSLTCDGPASHFTMFKELGCDWTDITAIRSYFIHPQTGSKVYAIFDVCHMLKLLRNHLATLAVMLDAEGRRICWEFIKLLHQLQEKTLLRAGNKLRKAHIEWQRNKMKVSLAAQTLSTSVAESLAFLREDIKYPGFENSEATENFIRLINNLFDILNSQHPFGKGYKSPLRLNNEWIWREFLISARDYLLDLKTPDGQLLLTTPKKTPILGFAITITSILGLYTDYIMTKKLSYMLTFKLSQDHLEQFFCCVRSRYGWNNNPSAVEFMHSFKRLLLHAQVKGEGGNCRVLDNTVILNVDKQTAGIYNKNVTTNRLYDLSLTEVSDHDYDILSVNLTLDIFEANVVTYIAGYVVKMVHRYIDCSQCLDALYVMDESNGNTSSYTLIKRKNRGGLIVPSSGVSRICLCSEKAIRKLLNIHDKKMPKNKNLITNVVNSICQQFYFEVDKLFPQLKDHFTDGPLFEEHPVILFKTITECFCKLRIYNLAKTYSETIQTDAVRHQLTKLILFNHQ